MGDGVGVMDVGVGLGAGELAGRSVSAAVAVDCARDTKTGVRDGSGSGVWVGRESRAELQPVRANAIVSPTKVR